MFVRVLRAAGIAIAGFGIAGVAHANGQLENVYQLWLGDLRSAYNDSVANIEGKKTPEAMSSSARLYTDTQQMLAATKQLQQDATTLAPSLGAYWTETLNIMVALNDAAAVVAGQVGHGKVDLTILKSTFAEADDDIDESIENSKRFGADYWRLMNDLVETTMDSWANDVTPQYTDVVEFLTDENEVEGAPAMKDLATIAKTFKDNSDNVGITGGKIAPVLSEIWKLTDSAVALFAIETGIVAGEVGTMPYQADFGTMVAYYRGVDDALKASNANIAAFGAKLVTICDTCR